MIIFQEVCGHITVVWHNVLLFLVQISIFKAFCGRKLVFYVQKLAFC